MKRLTFENTLYYTFDGARKGAKYSLDGVHYMNHGEFCECLAKHVLGYVASKDANTRFDMGEDIPELNASVKSWNCGLTDMRLSNDRDEYLAKFFAMSNPSTTYIWVDDYADMVDLYFMDYEEFKAFTYEIGTWDSYCSKIRFKLSRKKIVQYFEAKLANEG